MEEPKKELEKAPKLPSRPRKEILLNKRSKEHNLEFQNMELEKRFKKTNLFSKIAMGTGMFLVLMFIIVALVLLPVGDFGAIKVAAIMFLPGAMFLSAIGAGTRIATHRLYEHASQLVLRTEPVSSNFQLVLGSKGVYFLIFHSKQWRLSNEALAKDYPQVWTGMTAEVYFEEGSGKPLGMFTGEGVYWFI